MDNDFVDLRLLDGINQVLVSNPSTLTQSTYDLFCQLEETVQIMVYSKNIDQRLINLINNCDFIGFYKTFIMLMCDDDNDYLRHSENPISASFILLQYVLSNLTDTIPDIRRKFCDSGLISALFKLLQMPLLDFNLCIEKSNTRMLVHGACIILHNIIEFIPEAINEYQKCRAQEAFMKFFHPLHVRDLPRDLRKRINSRNIQLLLLQATCLSSLSFLIDAEEIDNLPNLNNLITVIVHGLEESLKSTLDLASESHGCTSKESLDLLIRLLRSEKVANALISSNVVQIVKKLLKLIFEVKEQWNVARYDANELVITSLTVIQKLISQRTATLSVFDWDLRQVLSHFCDETWSSDCRKLVQDINCFLNNVDQQLSLKLKSTALICENLYVRRCPGGHIVIIHDSTDENVAQDLMNSLRKFGFNVRRNKERYALFASNENYLTNVAVVIALINSRSHHDRHYVNYLKYAYANQMLIIPISMDKNVIISCWNSLIFPRKQLLFVSNPPNFDHVVRKLSDMPPYLNPRQSVPQLHEPDEDHYSQVTVTGITQKHLMISYTHTSKDIGKRLCKALEPYHNIWFDEKDCRSCFVEEMAEAVVTSRAVIALICLRFTQSMHCSREILLSYLHDKLIIPIQLEPNVDYPYWLERLKPDAILVDKDDLDMSQVVQIINERLTHKSI